MSDIQVFPSIENIPKSFKGILLDAYGVFWGGNNFGAIPGSKEAMHRLVKSGKVVGILSNSTQLAGKEIDKIAKQGFILEEHFHFLVTSGEIARHIFSLEKLPFKTPRKKFWLFGGVHPKFSSHHTIFEASPYIETTDLSEADFIYISIPHLNGEDQTDPDFFREEVAKLKKKGLPMVCANPDRFAHEGTPPRAVVRQGSIAALYEELGGEVYYIGKPSEIAYFYAMEKFIQHHITDVADVLMVGDTPETDIRGARKLGMTACLVTETGIMADRIEKNGFENAVQTLSNFDCPNYFIKRLGAI